MEKWRLETHAKLTHRLPGAAGGLRGEAGRAQAAGRRRDPGPQPGREPADDRTSCKKNCISILTDQHFDLFDAIETRRSNGAAADRRVRGGRRGRLRPLLRAGLRVGAHDLGDLPVLLGPQGPVGRAASPTTTPTRCSPTSCRPATAGSSVPARPGFEGAIDHFLTFGEIWNGGPLPPISSPLYLPIADEIAERLDRPGSRESRRATRGRCASRPPSCSCAPTTSCRAGSRTPTGSGSRPERRLAPYRAAVERQRQRLTRLLADGRTTPLEIGVVRVAHQRMASMLAKRTRLVVASTSWDQTGSG